MSDVSLRSHSGQPGFSMIELLIVVAIIAVMSVISIPYVVSYTSLYKSEEQSKRIMDLMRESGQLALNQRRTYRMEIDITESRVHIIDENGDANDTLVKSVPIEATGVLRMDAAPNGISRPNPPNYGNASFGVDGVGHFEGATQTIGNTVWAIRFRSDGSVVNAGNTPISATLFVYPPTSASSDVPSDARQVRAITLYGGSGAVRYWKYNGSTFSAG